MSNWTTYEATIKAGLIHYGFVEQPDNYELDDEDASNAFIHKGFTLKIKEIDNTSITSNRNYYTYLIELKISFRNTLQNTRSSNFGLFDDFLTVMFGNATYFPEFISIQDNPTFEDSDKSLKTSIGTVKFLYGRRGC